LTKTRRTLALREDSQRGSEICHDAATGNRAYFLAK